MFRLLLPDTWKSERTRRYIIGLLALDVVTRWAYIWLLTWLAALTYQYTHAFTSGLLLLSGIISLLILISFGIYESGKERPLTRPFSWPLAVTIRGIDPRLYQPLSITMRQELPRFSRRLVRPVATATAALTAVVVAWWFPNPMPGIIVFMGGSWAASLLLRYTILNQYPPLVQHALTYRHLTPQELPSDPQLVLPTLRQTLNTSHPDALLYALNILLHWQDPQVQREAEAHLPDLLHHHHPQVRQEVLRHIATRKQEGLLPIVAHLMLHDEEKQVKATAVRVYAELAAPEQLPLITPYLYHHNLSLRQAAVLGWWQRGDLDATVIVTTHLQNALQNPSPAERIFATTLLAEMAQPAWYPSLLPLLENSETGVRQAALRAAKALSHPNLWPHLLPHLAHPTTRAAAIAALAVGQSKVLPLITTQLDKVADKPDELVALLQTINRINAPEGMLLLLPYSHHPHHQVRHVALQGLRQYKYHAPASAEIYLHSWQKEIVAAAIFFLSCWADLGEDDHVDWLRQALIKEVADLRQDLVWLLTFRYEAAVILSSHTALTHQDPEKRQHALTALQLTLTPSEYLLLGPLLVFESPDACLEAWRPLSQQPTESGVARILALLEMPAGAISSWTRACAWYAAHQLEMNKLITLDHQPLIEELPMLATIEKVIFLKTIDIFSQISEQILLPLADLLEEIEVPANQAIFTKGEVGDSLYVVVSGKVRIHDGAKEWNVLGEREVFGEMAVLDPAPRSASVTAVTDARLLRLGQAPLYELMQEYTEVGWGIIQVLSRRLRQTQTMLTQV